MQQPSLSKENVAKNGLSREHALRLNAIVRHFHASRKRDAQTLTSVCRALRASRGDAAREFKLIIQQLISEKD
jgi:hypothetical protein